MSISHSKASQLIHADLDGSLSPKDRLVLEEHLASCAGCSAERASMAHLDDHLRTSLRGHWARRNVTAAELSKITAKVEAGSKRRFPFLSLGAGWLTSGAQLAAIAGVALLMAWMLGAITSTGGLQSKTATPEPGETATSEELTLTPGPTVEPCAVITSAPVDVWAGPGTSYARLGTINASTSLLVYGQTTDPSQLIWLLVSAPDIPSGWIAGYSRQGQDIIAACPALPVVVDTPPAPTDTPIPPTETPTPTIAPETPTPLTPASPTLPPEATSTDAPSSGEPEYQATVGCSQTTISGTTVLPATQVKVGVNLASNLLNQLAAVVVEIGPDGRFSAVLTYAPQPEGTRLIVGFGEWDGTKFLRPSTLFGADCTG